MPSYQICSLIGDKASNAQFKSFFKAAEIAASLERIDLRAKWLQQDLGSHSFGAYVKLFPPRNLSLQTESHVSRLMIVSTHDH